MIEDRWILDRPNSYIGRSVPRPDARRLTHGRGIFVDDITLPRMVHAAFVRSPYAHARIVSIDTEAAASAPGVVAVATGEDLARIHEPWVGVLTHLEGLKSAPQRALPVDCARWQGEAVVAVVAERREQAEDAAELVEIEWEEIPAATDMETALDADTPVIHADLGDNLAWQRQYAAGDVDAACAEADAVVEETYHFGRHTGVTLEPRGIVADFDPSTRNLIVHHSTQSPHMIAGHLRAAFRARGAPGAGDRQGCRRLVRDQGPHLCRRDGDGRAVDRAQAPGEVRR